MTLLHIVSEQTMQNVLPALALRPERLIQVRSGGERFASASRNIEAALREAGLEPEFLDYPLASEFPDLEQTRKAMKYWLPLFPNAVVNITGGTKLMSAGALLGAREFPGASILYCDTDQRRFVSLAERTLLPPMPAFDEAAGELTLRIVMAAHGQRPDQWKFDTADDRLLEFGRTAFELRTTHAKQLREFGYSKQVRDFFRSENGHVPKAAAKLNALLAADVRQAFRGELPDAVRQFFDAALAAGVLAREPSGAIHLAAPPQGHKSQSHVNRMANMLDGSWLELAVLDRVRRSPHFADAHWSVEPVSPAQAPEAASFGETDIIALRLPQGVLQLISCKTEVRGPLEHLEALRERATQLGGRFARATLALLTATNDAAQNLRRWGRLLGVEILIGPEIDRLAD
ncbi:MAG: hypothetical protein ACKV19_14990 [Verrucomicrobiales bacterium]